MASCLLTGKVTGILEVLTVWGTPFGGTTSAPRGDTLNRDLLVGTSNSGVSRHQCEIGEGSSSLDPVSKKARHAPEAEL